MFTCGFGWRLLRGPCMQRLEGHEGQQERRETALDHEIGDGRARVRHEVVRRHDRQDLAHVRRGQITDREGARLLQLEQPDRAVAGLGLEVDLQHDLVQVLRQRRRTRTEIQVDRWRWIVLRWIATQPVALVASRSFEGRTIADVVAAANKEPVNYTSPGRGVGHFAGEMLKQRSGIPMSNFTHINYNGSAPALTDVMAGRVPLMFDIWHSARRHVESGALKLVAGASAERLPGAKDVPSINESYPK